MTYADSIAGNVRAEMSRRQVTQSELANKIGMSQAQLSYRLNGRVEFKPSEIEKIARLFDLPIAVLTSPVVITGKQGVGV